MPLTHLTAFSLRILVATFAVVLGLATALAADEFTPLGLGSSGTIGLSPTLDRPLSDPVLTESVGSEPDVASSGREFLVVWVDGRSAPDFFGPARRTNLYAARVSLEGELLDATGILVASVRGLIRVPQVVWNGSAYLVGWHQFSSALDSEIVVATITSAGEVGPRRSVTIPPGGGESFVKLASNLTTTFALVGANYYQGFPANAEGFLLDSDGNEINRVTVDLGNWYQNVGRVALASDGSSYLLGVLVDSNLRTWRVTGTGHLAEQRSVILPSRPGLLDLTWGEDSYLAVWSEYHLGIGAARLSRNGDPLDTPRNVINSPAPFQIAVNWSGSRYTVLFTNGKGSCVRDCETELSALAVESDGTVVDGNLTRLSAGSWTEHAPGAAAAAGKSLLVWQAIQRDGRQTIVVKLDDREESVISHRVAVQRDPEVAAGQSVFLAVWDELRGYPPSLHVMAGRFDQRAAALDGIGIDLTGSGNFLRYPSVATNGSEFLVTWRERERIVGRRIDSEGRLHGASFVIATHEPGIETAAVTFDSPSNSYLVFWTPYQPLATDGARATRVPLSGSDIGETVRLSDDARYARRVNSDGPSHVLLSVGFTTTELTASFISRSLTLEQVVRFPSDEVERTVPRMAFNGSNYLLVWQSKVLRPASEASPLRTLLQVARMTSNGALLDGFDGREFAGPVTEQTSPVVVWDGRQFLLRWIEPAGGTSRIMGIELGADQPLIASRNPGRIVVDDSEALSLSFLLKNGPGRSILGYRRLHPEYLVARSFLHRDPPQSRTRAVRR